MNTTKIKKSDKHPQESKEFEFINFLFEELSNPSISIRQFLLTLCQRLVSYLSCNQGAVLLGFGEKYLPICPAEYDLFQNVKEIQFEELPINFKEKSTFYKKTWHMLNNEETTFFPISIESDLKLLFITQAETDHEIPIETIFGDFINKRIKIALKQKIFDHQNKIIESVYSQIFQNKLDSRSCWRIIAGSVVNFTIDLPYLRLKPLPDVRIFSYTEGDRYIHCEAYLYTSNQESYKHINTLSSPIKVDDSIFRKLIGSEINYLNINPAKEFSNQKFTSLNEDHKNQSALLLPIYGNGEVIGILDLEHKNKGVFSEYHVKLYKSYCEFISPIVIALKHRSKIRRERDSGMLYAMNNLLRRLASTYRHRTSTLLFKSRFAVDFLKENIDANKNDLTQRVGELEKFIEEFQTGSKSFLKALPEFLEYRKIELNKIVNDVVKDFRRRIQKEKIVIVNGRLEVSHFRS